MNEKGICKDLVTFVVKVPIKKIDVKKYNSMLDIWDQFKFIFLTVKLSEWKFR